MQSSRASDIGRRDIHPVLITKYVDRGDSFVPLRCAVVDRLVVLVQLSDVSAKLGDQQLQHSVIPCC